MSDAPLVRAEGLSRSFGVIEAVRDVSFTVGPGSVFGLLGPNGSGKTTTLLMLLGYLHPDAGSSYLLGEDSRRLSPACRQRIGYLSEEPFPYPNWSLEQVLRFVATFFPAWDWDHANALVARFGVPTRQSLSTLSVGQRRLAELLLVLGQKPDLLVLDDPAVGLDVTVRREFLWAALDVAREEGKAVLFTSHILTDVERVADTVGILHQGKLRALAGLDELKERIRRVVLPPELSDRVAAEGLAHPLPGEVARRWEQGALVVALEDCTPARLAELAARFPGCEVESMGLEDIFCALVGQPSAGAEGAEAGQEVLS